jgi:hypothetical protein
MLPCVAPDCCGQVSQWRAIAKFMRAVDLALSLAVGAIFCGGYVCTCETVMAVVSALPIAVEAIL